MTLEQYIENISRRYALGNSTEHTFRADLQQLLETLAPNVSATNEPKRIKCGAPDFVLMKREIPVGFIEAKDVGADLSSKNYKEQFERYKTSLNNLIFTDYLDFQLFIDGQFKMSLKIGEIKNGVIVPSEENFAAFTNLVKDFAARAGQTITSSRKLAEMMAGKARILSDVIEKSLLSDEKNEENSTLTDQMTAFKDVLIHDISEKEFADVYAQTIAYGMFAARLHDQNLDTFSRQEAAELIPKSNPFLRRLFGYIAGPDIDDRIRWIVDSLADIFRATNIVALLKDFGKATQTFDPIIHFYETFLSEYDPKLRKSRGVWYTPEPVVNFIVRAVDDVLKTEFGLKDGLADTSKTKIKVDVQGKKIEREVHKVQILDPATGTGTFLAEVIKQIHTKFAGQQGIWSSYVENDLIPRLNGFELLMASYAMAHLKLDLLLRETGYKSANNQRLNIYLTNSLEEHHPDTGTLWATWLSAEANEANHIKRDTPVMCVIGNPPYSGESQNKGKWIMDLMEDYKKEPGGKEKLNERNPKWINDDYVKFLRYGQHFIEENGEGILAFINPHGFLDNPTFRGMRWNLLKTYDKIYTIDLHGNSKKKETAPDGSPDVNVFDIMQGVSINIFVKTGEKKANELGKVFHFDLYGKRQKKYDFLIENSIESVDYKELPNIAPDYFFVEKDFESQKTYDKGFLIPELFPLNSVGIVTAKDSVFINEFRDRLIENVADNCSIEPELNKIQQITYRPFDNKFVYYDSKIIERTREKVMKHFLQGNNISLVIGRQGQVVGSMQWNLSFITESIIDFNLYYRGGGVVFPLYLYPEAGEQTEMFAPPPTPPFEGGELLNRTPNLNMEIVGQIADKLKLEFVEEKPPLNPPFEGGEQEEEDAKNSPPILGKVDALRGRGGNTQINNLPYLKTFRKKLRNNLTPAEASFWKIVQNKKFEGRKFRRQHSVGNYILDFYCPSEKLAIELDGQVHFNDAAREYDYERKLFLEHYGIKVLRFENKMVFEELEWMLGVIKNNFGWNKTTTPAPPSKGGEFLSEKFSPIDILDYIYSVLHSPSYREKYKEFLKIDFPRVPFPKDAAAFWKLVNLGGELRQIHLLESAKVEEYITQYPIGGDNIVGKTRFDNGKVWINETQYFAGVPETAWNFYIGGYQPAQKWLKDRKDRTLGYEDIFHYQKIIAALSATDALMREIDEIGIE